MALLNLFLFAQVIASGLAEVTKDGKTVPELGQSINDQFHNQDSIGQYKYGYVNGESSKEESRSLDGVTRGSYSYVDADGVLQRVVYQADAENGFRVSGTNIPSAPLTADSADETPPAFSKRLSVAARRIGADVAELADNKNNNKQIIKNKNSITTDDIKAAINDELKINKENDKNGASENPNAQQPDNGGYQYVFPLAPNYELSPLNTEYLMPIMSNIDYFVQPNQVDATKDFDYNDRITFLPLYQPDFFPPFARSFYSSPYAFLKGFAIRRTRPRMPHFAHNVNQIPILLNHNV